jgi:hypothetical protein
MIIKTSNTLPNTTNEVEAFSYTDWDNIFIKFRLPSGRECAFATMTIDEARELGKGLLYLVALEKPQEKSDLP